MPATLVQISTSPGGMPKLARNFGRVTRDGVDGDWQLNRKYHGGCDRAICLFSVEQYEWLRREHAIDLKPGDIGENFTTEGIDLDSIQAGDRLRVGETIIEITKVRAPCKSLNQWDPTLLKVIIGRSGWMAKVINPGTVRPGDAIELVGTESARQSVANSEWPVD
jgi:MOSC domain-containing protein YiiM